MAEGDIARGVLRGVVAAMAMTGLRRVTTGLGLVEQAPPERIAREGFPDVLARIPADFRDEAIELGHWSYGAVAGAAFGLLPAAYRRRVWAGPLYGLGIWAVFETGLAPLVFGLRFARQPRITERAAIAADHVLYGLVVGGRPHGGSATRAPRP